MRSALLLALMAPGVLAQTFTFRIVAPKASQVLVSASVGTLNPKPTGTVKSDSGMWIMPMQKDATGLWALTIGPLEPEVYRYVFFVDGVRAIDELNPNHGGHRRVRHGRSFGIFSPSSCRSCSALHVERKREKSVVCYLALTTPPTVEDPVPLHESLP
jgi:hypothetical protein